MSYLMSLAEWWVSTGLNISGADGQGMAEYGLILALVAVVVIVALTALGGGINSTMNTISGSF